MARHRSPDGHQQPSVPDEVPIRRYSSARIQGTRSTTTGTYRVASPSSAVRGRVVVAAVAIGAFAAAAAGQTLHVLPQNSNDLAPLDGDNVSALMGMGGNSSTAPDVLTVARSSDASAEAQKMVANARIMQARTADQQSQQQQDQNHGKYVKPADGTFTSGFGSRWGTTHYGVDIANRIGTPILAVTDGTVIEAGPASGFGLWVRIQDDDGTISVYGHVDSFNVHEGQRVSAGEQIARMGNRGNSTGPHLHFEIWDASGRKMNPQPWLADRGITL